MSMTPAGAVSIPGSTGLYILSRNMAGGQGNQGMAFGK